MAPLAIPLMIMGTAASAGGQIYSGMAANSEGKSAQNMAEYNAKLQEREAQAIEQRSAIEQKRQAQAAARQRSTMIAGMAKSGNVISEGSPLQILSEQAGESELENMMLGYNSAVEAQRARSQGQADIMQGKIARRAGKNTRFGSFIGAGATALSGFNKISQYTRNPNLTIE